jgi:hypothetical protein
MNTNNDTYSVTDLRHRTNEVLKQAAAKGFVYLIRHSQVEAAIVDLDYLTALKEVYEDYLDTLEFDKTITLKRIPLENHKRLHHRST